MTDHNASLPLDRIQLGDIASFEMGQSPDSRYVSDSQNGIPFLQGNAEFGAVHPQPRLWCRQPKKVCQTGDSLISVRAPVGALNQADQAYCIGRGLAAVRFHGANPRYGAHLLAHFAPNLRRKAQGTTFEAVGKDDLVSLEVNHFPDAEHDRIAEVLDTLDGAIRETETLTNKLHKMREGLLVDLLTRGVTNNGDIRPSWTVAPQLYKKYKFGLIPNAWAISRIGEQFEIQLGKMLDSEKNTGVLRPYIGNKAVQWDHIDTSEPQFVPMTRAEMDRFRLQVGDLLVCEGGEVGRAALWEGAIEECYYQKALHRLRPIIDYRPQLLLEYLRYWVRSDMLSEYVSKTSIAHLTQEKLSIVPLPVPEADEQDQIIAILNSYRCSHELEQRQLDKLRGIKSGISLDLLTGRVRTRPH